MSSYLKTTMLFGLLTGLLLGVGYLIGGFNGLTIGLIFALGFNFVSYWFSDKIVLMMYKAKEAKKEDYKELHYIVEDVAMAANIPKPKVYIINTPQMNAFATGRNPKHAVVACTAGILKALDKYELKGVIAHEIGHIKNKDILISTVAAGIAGLISYVGFIARWGAIFGGFGGRDNNSRGILELLLLGIITPLIATLIRLAISRSREFAADATSAKLTGNPEGLASALEKISVSVKNRPFRSTGATNATAHLFISNPLKGGGFLHLFSSHPKTEERTKRLRNMQF